jgi:hypothetical protein
MKENNKNIDPGREKMEQMLADYAFDKLDYNGKQVFENALDKYSDLRKQAEEIRILFKDVRPENFQRRFSEKTRNLSVRVNERMTKENQSFYRFGKLTKYLIPAAGLAIVIFFFIINGMLPDFFTKTGDIADELTITENEIFTGITSSEARSIFDGEVNEENVIELTENTIKADKYLNMDLLAELTPKLLETAYNEYFDEMILDDILNDIESLEYVQLATQYDYYEQLENLEEEEFEYILKELENADFNS